MTSPIPSPHGTLSRRSFAGGAALLGICAAAGAAGLASLTRRAQAEPATGDLLADAQSQYDSAMAELSSILGELEGAQARLDKCEADLALTEASIAQVSADIQQKQAELSDAQDALAERVGASYRAGETSLLDVVLDASSFEDLVGRLYYAGKVNESDASAIRQVKDLKSDLESQEASLREQKAAQEQLLVNQRSYTQGLRDSVSYYEDFTGSLSNEVMALMDQAQQEALAARDEQLRQWEAEHPADQDDNGTDPTPTPSPSPSPTSSPDPTPAPEPTPEPNPEPDPEPTPSPEPEPEPTPDPDPEPTPEPDPEPEPEPDYGNHVPAVASIAWNYVGLPYVWGGTGPDGYDCSGLAQRCYADAGYWISRTTYTQYNDIMERGQMKWSLSELEPGDLLFPDSDLHHVTIYIGGGSIIHASTEERGIVCDPVYSFYCGGCPV